MQIAAILISSRQVFPQLNDSTILIVLDKFIILQDVKGQTARRGFRRKNKLVWMALKKQKWCYSVPCNHLHVCMGYIFSFMQENFKQQYPVIKYYLSFYHMLYWSGRQHLVHLRFTFFQFHVAHKSKISLIWNILRVCFCRIYK